MVERLPINFPGRESAEGQGGWPVVCAWDSDSRSNPSPGTPCADPRPASSLARWPLIGTCSNCTTLANSYEIGTYGRRSKVDNFRINRGIDFIFCREIFYIGKAFKRILIRHLAYYFGLENLHFLIVVRIWKDGASERWFLIWKSIR